MHLTQHARGLTKPIAYGLTLLLFFLVTTSTLASVSENEKAALQRREDYELHDDTQTESKVTADTVTDEAASYFADFLGLEESIVGRTQLGGTPLGNNAPANLNILPGTTNSYEFLQSSIIEGRSVDTPGDLQFNDTSKKNLVYSAHNTPEEVRLSTRQAGSSNATLVYVSLTTCLQPSFNNSADSKNPPQLLLYWSTSDGNQQPGSNSDGPQSQVTLVEGFAAIEVNVTKNLYLGVSAPNVTTVGDVNIWNYELAVSINAPFHSFNDSGSPFLFLVDSDRSAALLVTQALDDAADPEIVDNWAKIGPPFSIFIQRANDTSVKGVSHSYCGMANTAQIKATNADPGLDQVQTGITTRGGPQKQEFYVPYLNGSSIYNGYLAITGNTTDSGGGVVRGGGTVYPAMNFTTKADGNCAVIFNLTFCDEVAYAVPSNPDRYTTESLSALYDSDAAASYGNFSYSLQQIPCNTTSTAQYSLARNCDDCAASYKTWLCAVTIPRCADFSSPPATDGYLRPRNAAQAPIPGSGVPAVTNQTLLGSSATAYSRNNHTIVGLVQPGPYKEVLPCETLCFDLVSSCPAALGFSCPLPGKGLEVSYGKSGEAPNGAVSCSAPGAVYYPNAAIGVKVDQMAFWAAMVVVVIMQTVLG